MAKIIKADGHVLDIEPKNGTDFSLEELKSVVGGHIEIVYLNRTGSLMVVNEEGKLEGLDYNMLATEIALNEGGIPASDFIVGDVLVCNNDQIK